MESTESVRAEASNAEWSQAAGGGPATIPFTPVGASGEDLVFLHANGYPPECYLPLLSALATEHRVLAMHQRPLWAGSRPEVVNSWHPLTDDLLRFLDERGEEKVIAVGHSMGAIVALRAAMRAPGCFERLVLLDPVLMRRSTMLMWRLFRTMGTGHRLHVKIKSTLRRRRGFASVEEAFHAYRGRGVFSYMSDDALRIMIAGLVSPAPNGGFALRYSPEWEAHIYHTAIWKDSDLWDRLPGLSVPTLIVRGAESDTLTESTCRAVQRANPGVQLATIARASHLVPLEQPGVVHASIREFLRDLAAEPGRDVKASTGAGKAPAPLHD
jgi:pimeloyl-ACP methyl ester carboxylesterase